jgi:hypothetical protein
MVLAMLVGMADGALALVLIFSTVLASNVSGMTPEEVSSRYPVLICLMVATIMILAMTGWMRRRDMAWRPVVEMAAAMALALLPIFGLRGVLCGDDPGDARGHVAPPRPLHGGALDGHIARVMRRMRA